MDIHKHAEEFVQVKSYLAIPSAQGTKVQPDSHQTCFVTLILLYLGDGVEQRSDGRAGLLHIHSAVAPAVDVRIASRVTGVRVLSMGQGAAELIHISDATDAAGRLKQA